MLSLENADQELVAQARRGDRDAFGRIVARYQALICALAYNATGSLAQSEDLAQEAFVVAWKQLPSLHDPEKLRSWLCGIVKNLGRRARRNGQSDPLSRAEPLESAGYSLAAPGAHPLDQAISRDEEDILWRQLEAIPETYREPLILFYRQHASIEQVALALELSEDVVRQRLTRGRRLLQEQIRIFVESALERTSPKPAFTQNVMAALPAAAASSGKVAGAALAAASGSAAKGAWAASGPLGGVFALLAGVLVTRRGMTGGAKSPREQRFLNRISWIQTAALFPILTMGWIMGRGWSSRDPLIRDLAFFAFFFSAWVLGTGLSRWRSMRQRQIQIEDHTLDEAEWRPQPLGNGGPKCAPGSEPFSAHLKRSALSFVFVLICAFQAPWKQHFSQALVYYVCLPTLTGALVLLLVWGLGFRNRSRHQRPPLVFLAGFPITVTLVVMDLDLFAARTRGVVSVLAIILSNAAVILAFSAWTGILLRTQKSTLRRMAY